MEPEEYTKMIDLIAKLNGITPMKVIMRHVLQIPVWQNVTRAINATAKDHIGRRYEHYLKGSWRDHQIVCFAEGERREDVLVERVEKLQFNSGEVVIRGRYNGKEVVWIVGNAWYRS